MKVNGEVKYAKLHTPIFIPGLGNVKETLTASAQSMDLKMYLYDNVMLVQSKGITAAIPLAQIQNVVFSGTKLIE